MSVPPVEWLEPYVDVMAGRYSRERPSDSRFVSTALSAEAGTVVELTRTWSLRLGARYLRALDGDYEDLMGRRLYYALGTVALWYGVGW
ncbi:MAG TPA: hypothetical protein VMM12_04290 [Longimicrobiales bacterium]|nr:hypothetical protein [Longimicrobiales bacterium]